MLGICRTNPVIHKDLPLLLPFGLLHTNRRDHIQSRDIQLLLSVDSSLLLQRRKISSTLLWLWRRTLAFGFL